MSLIINPNGHCRLCTEKDRKDNMVSCDECDRWFHISCAKLDHIPTEHEPWFCVKCIETKKRERRHGAADAGPRHAMMQDVTNALTSAFQNAKLVKDEENANNVDWSTFLKRQTLVNLPKFTGTAKEWPKFKKIFEETTKDGKFDGIENLSRLQQSLEGAAAKSVSSLMIDSGNIKLILERLELNFGRPEIIYKDLLADLSKIRKERHSIVIDISEALESLVSNLELIKFDDYLRDPRLVDETVRKLPYNLQIKWLEDRQNKKTVATLKELNNFLTPHATIMRMMQVNTPIAENRKGTVNMHQQSNKQGFNIKCGNCSGTHRITDCQQFRDMNEKQRNEVVKNKRLCISCLSPSHYVRDCIRPKRCGKYGCNNNHHSWLHEDYRKNYSYKKQPKQESNEEKSNEENKTREDTVNCHRIKRSKVLYQIIPVTLRNGPKSVETYAFLDAGSSVTLIDESIAKKLELNGRNDPLQLKWTQDISKDEDRSKNVELKIIGPSKKGFTMKEVRTMKNLQLPTQTVDYEALKQKYNYLKDVQITSYIDAKPMILIGLTHTHLLIPLERRMGKWNEPIAARSKLGWFMFGNISASIQQEYSMIHHEEEMMKMMKSYFATEDFGVKLCETSQKSKEEKRVEKIMDQTLNYTNGRYEVGLLWKTDNTKFPKSYINAFNRLRTLEKQLEANDDMKKWAMKTFNDYQTKGYLRKLTPEEVKKTTNRTYYLPHFIVVGKNKTKPRLVFDAAAKIDGISFNSELLSGPDINEPIHGVALRFREGEIAICGDIQEMFHQTKIIKEDQDSQRILWRDCITNKDPDVYVLQVMTFGATCSPFCAQYVKNKNAEKFGKIYPEAAIAVKKQHFVDDYLDSYSSINDARQIANQVIDIHQHAGYFIRNFISNNKELMASIPEDRRHKSAIKLMEDKESEVEKVLGLYWNTTNDCLGYQIKINSQGEKLLQNYVPTMREVLAYIMSIYDPLGLISDLSIHGRILMQELHKASSKWDDVLPVNLQDLWKTWLITIKEAENIAIPRCITEGNVDHIELHTFVDASEKAFSAGVYARSFNEKGICVRLITGKARVAPIKGLSIPRLELQAAVLGTRLTKVVQKELRLNISKVTFWSDSQTVLSWIKKINVKFQVFISHRIGEILDSTTMDQWRWVPSANNPADAATKITSNKNIWLNGPDFLRLEESEWPDKSNKEIYNFIAHHSDDYDKDKCLHETDFEDWWKLIKTICIIRKYTLWRYRDRTNVEKGYSIEVRKKVENALYRKAQMQGFPEEMEDLLVNGQVSNKSHIRNLSPFLDEFGVMRSNGRLEKALKLSKDVRQPIILPQKHQVTRLVVKSMHEKYLHQGENSIIAALQQKFWIINVRAVVKNIKNCCQKCIISNAKPKAPMMAALPEFRTTPFLHPFTYCGIDYFGPFDVMVKRSTEKRWGVIFTCLSSRAVHIEMAEKLSTDSFICCLRSFQNRRGKVTHIYSDNGTNFVGANNLMKKLLEEIDQRMGSNVAAKMEIKWTFNPPAASHFGGVWERLIRIIRSCLVEMIESWGKRTPQCETLRDAFTEAEFFLNARPLTHIPVDNMDDEVLTPFHALINRSGEYAPPMAIDVKEYDKEQFKQIENAGKVFWNRWQKEFIPTLAKRNKWTNKIEPIKLDDIVLIVDDTAPPNTWLKGRVINVHTASDGQVRSADVETIKGVIKRPAIKIAVLDVTGSKEKDAKQKIQEYLHKKQQSLLHISDNSFKREVSLDKQFPNWGKRKTTDEEKVKEIRETVSSRKRPRRNSSVLAKAVLATTTLLSIANAMHIKPIEEEGLIFDHEGTCVQQRGSWKININSGISPTQDIQLINHIHQNLTLALQEMEKQTKDSTVHQLASSIGHQCDEAIQEIQQSTRIRRSKGIFGFLKDIFFGGDDIDEAMEAMRVQEDNKIHHVSETIKKVYEKSQLMNKQLQGKLSRLYDGIHSLDHGSSMYDSELLHGRLMETSLLAKQMVEDIIGKYRKLREFPLSISELENIKQNITSTLPVGYTLLDHPSAINFESKIQNDTIVIVMNSVLISKDNFEVFHVISIPNAINKTKIVTTDPLIALNSHGEYFYPSEKLDRINLTHYIVNQPEIIRKPDCVAAALQRTKSEEKCSIEKLPSKYSKLIKLSKINTVLYYTSNPKEIVIHCENVIISPPYEAAIVNMDPDCKIKSNLRTIYANMKNDTKKTLTFFQPKAIIQFNNKIEHRTLIKNEKPQEELKNIEDSIDINEENYTFHKYHPYSWVGILILIILFLILGIAIYCKYCRSNANQASVPLNEMTNPTFNRRLLTPSYIQGARNVITQEENL